MKFLTFISKEAAAMRARFVISARTYISNTIHTHDVNESDDTFLYIAKSPAPVLSNPLESYDDEIFTGYLSDFEDMTIDNGLEDEDEDVGSDTVDAGSLSIAPRRKRRKLDKPLIEVR
jgi:hypothetical protein